MDADDLITTYHDWSDEDLVGLLHVAGDRLPGDVVTELAIRHERTKELLRAILEDRREWSKAGVSSWAAIHAFLLFLDPEMGDESWSTEARWATLMTAVRYAIAYDLDEGALADLPLVVAGQGQWVWNALPSLALDRSRPPRERRVWLLALGAAAQRHGGSTDLYLDAIREVAGDAEAGADLRGYAARRLLDWRRESDRDLLAHVAAQQEAGPGIGHLLPEDVAAAYRHGTPDLTPFQRNWQQFYYRDFALGQHPGMQAIPLPSWRVEERDSTWRAAEPFLDVRAAEIAGLKPAARWLLDDLVMRRLAPVRGWRLLDVAAAMELAGARPDGVPDEAKAHFAASCAAFIESLGTRELIESGDWRVMAEWLRRRAGRIERMLGLA